MKTGGSAVIAGKRTEYRFEEYIISKGFLLITLLEFLSNKKAFLNFKNKQKWYIKQPPPHIFYENIIKNMDIDNSSPNRSKDDFLLVTPIKGGFYIQRIEVKSQQQSGTPFRTTYEKLDDEFNEDRFLIIVDGIFFDSHKGIDEIKLLRKRMDSCQKDYSCITFDEMVKTNLLFNFNL